MVDIVKQDMTDLWAISGDVVAPDSAKVRAGWAVEVVPRQWWNWMQYRADSNIAYLLQKGIPEWDATTEYLANKSFVTSGGVVYKCLFTNTGQPVTSPTHWARAFADYSLALSVLGSVTPAADRLPYFTGTNSASTTAFTSFSRTLLANSDAASMRTTLSAQASHSNLTALSGVTAATNVLPYFTGTTTMAGTPITSFGRSLVNLADAQAARTLISVYSTTEVDANLSAGLSTKQPLDATLTALAGLATGVNQLAYSTGVDSFAQTPITPFARDVIAGADALAVRTTIGADNATNLTTGQVALARLPNDLVGKNAATATALQTPRTIQGVLFDGTANITLPVVIRDSATGSAQLPAGTTSQRTASPSSGMIRYNTDLNELERYQNTQWLPINSFDKAVNLAPAVTIPSAATVDIGAAGSNSITISGTATITSFGTAPDGYTRRITFSNALTLTYNSTSLILPGNFDIAVSAGDVAEFVSLGGGNWRCVNYLKRDGSSTTGGGLGIGQSWTQLSGSRVIGTTYTNTTGKPISVSVGLSVNVGVTAQAIVDSVTLGSLANNGSGGNIYFMTFIVPVASTYRVAGATGVVQWAELR